MKIIELEKELEIKEKEIFKIHNQHTETLNSLEALQSDQYTLIKFVYY